MSGGLEAAGAVGKVASKALTPSEEEAKLLREMAKDHPAMVVAAGDFAKRVAIRQAVLTRLYQPLAWAMGVRKTYFLERFAEELAAKTASIPEEHLQTPPASIAFPVMQGLGYTLDEPTLKEMYLTLLATATDDRRGLDAHPAFAETIRQLSASEAAVLPEYLVEDRPIVKVLKRDQGASFERLAAYITDLRDPHDGTLLGAETSAMWIDNWTRLGLVEVDYSAHILGDGAYAWVGEHPAIRGFHDSAPPDKLIEIEQGILWVTNFGKRFASAVSGPVPEVDDEQPPAAP